MTDLDLDCRTVTQIQFLTQPHLAHELKARRTMPTTIFVAQGTHYQARYARDAAVLKQEILDVPVLGLCDDKIGHEVVGCGKLDVEGVRNERDNAAPLFY
jgi:hypothetical protein